MQYDLDLLIELCGEIGFPILTSPANSVQIDLGSKACLEFLNWPEKNDCLLGFPDTGWHTHGDLLLVKRDSHALSFDQMEVVTGLANGKLLICERWANDVVKDRELVLQDFCVSEEFEFNSCIELRLRRATTKGC